MGTKQNITQERLKELLCYDSDTGIFTWRKSLCRKIKCGSLAGCVHPNGYIRIHIDNKLYSAHRLAWLYVHGFTPTNLIIDHINNIRTDNRIENLRIVSSSCNAKNRTGLSSDNTSGVTGVFWDLDRWRVFTKDKEKTVYHGRFTEFADAVRARYIAEIECGYHDCKGESTAYLWLIDNNESLSVMSKQHKVNFRLKNKSGVSGVSFSKEKNKWVSKITVSKKIHHLGYYVSFSDAVQSRWDAEAKYGYPDGKITSSAYQYLKDHNLLPKE